jgi:hypothetical protein
MIGEIRDAETMTHAINYAQSGHLCLSTLHANNSYHMLNRVISLFPTDSRNALLMDLSVSLRAVISQRLVPTKDGKQITFRVRGQTEALPITVIIGKQPVDEAGFDDEDDFVPIPREDRSLRLTERTHVVFFPHSGIVGAELNNRGAYMSQFADLINDKLPNLGFMQFRPLFDENITERIDSIQMAAATDWESPCVASSLLRPSLDHHTAVPNCCFAYPQMIGVGNRSCRGLAATVSFIVIARLVALKPAPVMALSM